MAANDLARKKFVRLGVSLIWDARGDWRGAMDPWSPAGLGGETCGEELAGVNIRPVATPTRPGHSSPLHTIVQSCSIHYFTVQVSTTLHH